MQINLPELEIMLLIWRSGRVSSLTEEDVAEAEESMIDMRLLRRNGDGIVEVTERGTIMLDALMAVPLPKQRMVWTNPT